MSWFEAKAKKKKEPGLEELSQQGIDCGFNWESFLLSPGGVTAGDVCVGEAEWGRDRESNSSRVCVGVQGSSVVCCMWPKRSFYSPTF